MNKKIVNNNAREIEINIYEGNPEKALIICHGASEGTLRYAQMAEYFKQYFTVITYNHPGHETGSAVDFTYDQITGDTAAVVSYVQKQFTDVTIFAHSMGSLVIRNVLSFIKSDTKLILSGAPVLSFNDTVQLYGLAVLLKYSDKDEVSDKLNFKLFDEKSAKLGLTDKQWLSTNQYIVDIYRQSKLANQKFTNRGLLALTELSLNANTNEINQKLNKYKLMLVSGGTDVFTANGKAYQKLSKSKDNTSTHIYPNSYHEVHNDVDRQQLFEDILQFTEKELNGKN